MILYDDIIAEVIVKFIKVNDLEMLKFLLEIKYPKFNVDGSFPWRLEVSREILEYLKERMTKQQMLDNSLQKFCASDDIEMVKLLLDKGANVHAEYDFALRRASSKGNLEVVKLSKERMNEKV